MRTALVLPIYNEADNLAPLFEHIERVRGEAGLDLDVLAVDDGSADASLAELSRLQQPYPYLAIHRHEQNRGFAGALRTGIEQALSGGYDAVVIMDADLTHDPADVLSLLNALRQGADLAIGSRYVPGGRMESVPFVRAAISQVGNVVGRLALGSPIRDMTSGYRAYRRSVLEMIELNEQGFGIQLEAVVKARRAGFRVVEVPITLRVRSHGYSKMVYNLSFWLSYARLFARLAFARRSAVRGERPHHRVKHSPPAHSSTLLAACKPKRVSVVATVLNEGAAIDRLMASLAGQSRAPDEVIVVDGGSEDDTAQRAAAWQERLPLQTIAAPGANISQGRNAGIALATGGIIAVTDAGVRLGERWLAEIVAPFEVPGPPDVVAGFFCADPETTFEAAMGATVLPSQSEIDPDRFLPSSRSVAFTKEVWERVGGYPEWLDYCEDVVFDLRLKAGGCRFAWAPDALAHFRPRGSLKAFFRQYFLYARGDGKAGLWPRRHLARYTAYVVAPIALLTTRNPLVTLFIGASAAYYLYRPYVRLLPTLGRSRPGEAAKAAALVPIIRIVGDLAKMLGYPTGLWWRLRRGRVDVQ